MLVSGVPSINFYYFYYFFTNIILVISYTALESRCVATLASGLKLA